VVVGPFRFTSGQDPKNPARVTALIVERDAAERRMSQLVKKFDVRTACVVNQFNALDVGEGLHHNGKQVLGEALGDLGAQQCKLW
jgi:hypothetical protein